MTIKERVKEVMKVNREISELTNRIKSLKTERDKLIMGEYYDEYMYHVNMFENKALSFERWLPRFKRLKYIQELPEYIKGEPLPERGMEKESLNLCNQLGY